MTDVTNTISETTTAQAAQAEARAMYRKSAAAGFPLTGKELAEHFGRKERWGQERIREAKDEARESSPGLLPGEMPQQGLPPVATPPAIRAPQSEPQTVSAPTAGPQGEPQKPQEPSAETAEMIMSPVRVSAETAEPQSEPHAAADELQEPQQGRKPIRTWPVWALMLPAAVAIWGGWVGLGEMAGFGVVNLLPGIGEGFEVNTAITLPIGMEVYAAYALYVWLSGRAQGKAKAFAKRSAITSLVIGAAGQMAYHVMEAAGVGVAPWYVTALVACLPVAVLGMGAALAHMVKAETE